jgi:uncharacterized protein (TIGR02145 family)
MKKLAVLTIIMGLTLNLEGQSPQKLSYQCVVRYNDALVKNQPVGMRISILQGSLTGPVVYQEIYNPNPQTNANGLVTLEVGTGIPVTGTFSLINWASGQFFLKTEIDPSGGTNYLITGTTQLLSVPFALYATTSGNGFSGNYNDLTNKPLLFDGTWSSLTGKPAFAIVATSGSYNDLLNKPLLFSGSYNDLTNKPALFDGAFSSLTGKPTTVSGYGITDAMTTAHPADAITSTSVTNWNTAFGWGNHATAGYVPGTRTITINGTTLNLSANNTWNVGTVTSVGLSLPSIFSVSGSPVTSLGTLSATLASQTANLIFASPNGTAGTPAFRALVSSDMPNLDWSKITTGKPTTLAGYGITDAMNTSHPANGITAANITNWTSAFGWGDHSLAGYAKYPSQTGNSGRYLTTNGTITSWASLATVALTGSYNDLTNKPAFDGTFASLTGKPTTVSGYGITDAMTTAHAANVITSTSITNWNTAYGWGNHATAGYVPGTRTITINGTTLNLTANNTWNVGTVTSVGLSLPSIFSVSGSPVTSLGTLTASLASQSANRVFAAPNGTTGTPVFRSLVSNDIPNLDWNKISTGKPTTLSGYGITDALSTSHPAYGITASNITYWNNKLDSYNELDPIFKSSVSAGITQTDTSRWNNNNNQTLASILLMGNDGDLNQIKNIGYPTHNSDAATKEYVDYLLHQINSLNQRLFELETLATSGKVTDYDGNTYNTVKIGNQIWMQENLKVTHYSDGTQIPRVDDPNVWSTLGDNLKGYSYYNNNQNGESNIYGALYSWAAAMNGQSASNSIPSNVQGVCPTGWHLPSDAEWIELEVFLGMDPVSAAIDGLRGNTIGGKLKETGITHWANPNDGATNASGFNGLPGGRRLNSGVFTYIGSMGSWWSTTYTIGPKVRFLENWHDSVGRANQVKGVGNSCRCIKD